MPIYGISYFPSPDGEQVADFISAPTAHVAVRRMMAIYPPSKNQEIMVYVEWYRAILCDLDGSLDVQVKDWATIEWSYQG